MNKNKLKNWGKQLLKAAPFLIIAFLFLGFFFYADELFARPGGGHGHSGGGRSSGGGHSGGGGSGGGGGDGRAILYFIMYSLPSVPAAIGLFLLMAWKQRDFSTNKKLTWSAGTLVGIVISAMIFSMAHLTFEYYGCGLILCGLALYYGLFSDVDILQITSAAQAPQQQVNSAQVGTSLQNIIQKDADFSKILFLDYLRGLFHQFYYYGNVQKLDLLTPFIDKALLYAREKDLAETGVKISELVIGNATIRNASIDKNGYQHIWVDVESNYTLTNRKLVATRLLVTETWELVRNPGVCSLPPEKMQVVSCPNCGGAADFTTAGNCRNCGTTIKAGEHQWFLNEIRTLNKEQFETQDLGTYVQESGTNLSTVYDSNFSTEIKQIAQNHGTSDVNTYLQKMEQDVVVPVFMRIYEAWSEKKWHKARHLLSDFLYESQNFWMELYDKKQLTNRLENIHISKVIPVKAESDTYYESLTFRIYAECLDYTVNDATGKVIGGSKSSSRDFTEYWTFVRRKGKNQKELSLNNCPNCGAPVDKMGMSGVCGYCNTKVSTGEFSWVLAFIAQDEVYRG